MATEASAPDQPWEEDVLDALATAGELLDRNGQRELANLVGQLYQQVGYQVIGDGKDEEYRERQSEEPKAP